MLTTLLLFATIVTSGSCPIGIQSVHTFGLVTTITFRNRNPGPLRDLEIVASFGDGRTQFYQYVYRVPGTFAPRRTIRISTPPMVRAVASYEAFEMDCTTDAGTSGRTKYCTNPNACSPRR